MRWAGAVVGSLLLALTAVWLHARILDVEQAPPPVVVVDAALILTTDLATYVNGLEQLAEASFTERTRSTQAKIDREIASLVDAGYVVLAKQGVLGAPHAMDATAWVADRVGVPLEAAREESTQ